MKAGETIVESQVLFVLCISDSPNKLFPKANGAKKITEELLQKRTVQKRLQKSYSKSELYKKITEELLQKRTVQKRLQKSYSKSELYKYIPHFYIISAISIPHFYIISAYLS